MVTHSHLLSIETKIELQFLMGGAKGTVEREGVSLRDCCNECKGAHPRTLTENDMKAAKTIRVHSVDGDRYHWAMSVDKAGICPTCATPNGQLCVGKHKLALPRNTVHISRVRALGHGAR